MGKKGIKRSKKGVFKRFGRIVEAKYNKTDDCIDVIVEILPKYRLWFNSLTNQQRHESINSLFISISKSKLDKVAKIEKD